MSCHPWSWAWLGRLALTGQSWSIGGSSQSSSALPPLPTTSTPSVKKKVYLKCFVRLIWYVLLLLLIWKFDVISQKQEQGKEELLHNPEQGVLAAEDHPGLCGENCAIQHLALRAERGTVLKRKNSDRLLLYLHGPVRVQQPLQQEREMVDTQEPDRYDKNSFL